MTRPAFDLAAVEQATAVALELGHAVLQTHYYADTEAAHVAKLLEWMDPPAGAMVLDAGSGVGEVSRLMGEARPDLAFLLVNVSPMQLGLGPADSDRFHRLQADCHDLRPHVPDGFAQAVMFSSSLCQMDAPVALAEAWRVLAQGGVLLINDMVTDGDSAAFEQALAARVMSQAALLAEVDAAGFDVTLSMTPDSTDAHFRAMLAGQEQLMQGISPVVIRAVKRGAP